MGLNNDGSSWKIDRSLLKDCTITHGKDILQGVKGIEKKVRGNKDIKGIITYLEKYDYYTFTHSVGVMSVAMGVATELGYNERDTEDIGMGALLHDVGKVCVPRDILTKPSKLTRDEYNVIKLHPNKGESIFNSFVDTRYITLGVEKSVKQHHERIDGSGYPYGEVRQGIHDYAQIIAVADVYDAMTNRRVYRKEVGKEGALDELNGGKGILYNREVVSALESRYK